ncbi:MAG: hypothetical protein WCV50_02595 [Patescibacteria group bacterium]|jgi:hypothetical protein
MSSYSIIFDRLLICDPDKSRSICHIFISHQSPAEESSLGKLFLITEISSHDKINMEIINAIHEELKISYYNTEDLNIETAFEKALESANQRIADMVGDYETNWLDKLNTIAAVINKNTLFISNIGTMHAFLIRGSKITNILDTIIQGETLKEKINPLKAFSNIVSGTLDNNDDLLFCTPSMFDFLSQEKLKRVIKEHSPAQAISMLDQILTENVTNTSFGAIIIKLATEQITQPANATVLSTATPVVSSVYQNSQSSMESLAQKQEITDQVMSPSLTRYFSQMLHRFSSKISKFIKLKVFKQSPRRIQFSQQIRQYQPAQQPNNQEHSNIASLGRTASRGGRSVVNIISKSMAALFSLAKRKEEIKGQVKSVPTKFSQKISNSLLRFNRLPGLSKIILGLVVVIAFVLAQSFFSQAASNQKNQQGVEFDSTVSSISQNILKAEAALSYGNEQGAKDLLTEAQTLVSQLPKNNKDQENKINELTNSINIQLEKTRHLTNVALTEIASITDQNQPVNVKDSALLNSTIYTFDPAKKTIYGINLDNAEINSWPQAEDQSAFQYLIPQTANTLLFFNTANSLAEFNTDKETLKNLSITFPNSDVNIASIYIYQSRLYLLDIKNNQIYRAAKTANGYGSVTSWVKDDTSLANAKSLAVDGFVYVLDKNGTLTRMFQGARQNWKLDDVNPQLNNADKVWTDQSSTNIYVMDIKGKRIVEFNKNGQLQNQYTNDSLSNLKDFSVDVAGKKIFVLNGNKISSFPI